MDGSLWLAAALLALVALALGGPGADAEATSIGLLLPAAGAALALMAFLAGGIADRPILGLSMPVLAGWWAATATAWSLVPTLVLAAAAGAAAGLVLAALSTGPAARAAALSLAAAVIADIVSDHFVGEPLPGFPAPTSAVWPALIAAACLAFGWRAEGSLAAALLHNGGDRRARGALGMHLSELLALACALGGIAGGVGGALLAAAGAGPPELATGLILAAAAFAAGGSMAGTFALTLAIWVLPKVRLGTDDPAQTISLWLAAGAVAAAVATNWYERRGERGDG